MPRVNEPLVRVALACGTALAHVPPDCGLYVVTDVGDVTFLRPGSWRIEVCGQASTDGPRWQVVVGGIGCQMIHTTPHHGNVFYDVAEAYRIALVRAKNRESR